MMMSSLRHVARRVKSPYWLGQAALSTAAVDAELVRRHVGHFKAHGYTTDVPVLTPSQVADLRASVAALEKTQPGNRLPPQYVNLGLEYKDFWDTAATSPVLLEIFKGIFDTPDIMHLSTTLFTKYPRDPAGTSEQPRVGWHQDHLFWALEPQRVLTVWMAVDDADEDNGCLRVVPDSHNKGLVPHEFTEDSSNVLMAFQDIPEESFGGRARSIPLPLKAGHASLHCGFTIHGSPPNMSTSRRRAGFTLQVFPSGVRLGEFQYENLDTVNVDTVTEEDWRKPVVLCGRDTVGMECLFEPPRERLHSQ